MKQHTAFVANTGAQVDAFYAAALKAGGTDKARRVFVIPPKVTRGVTTPPSYSIRTAIIMSMSAIGVTADKGRLFLGTHAAKRCLGKLGGYLGYLGFARRIFGDDATDFLNWQWSADEEALHLGAAEHTYLRELVGGLDAFGRCNHA